MPVLLPVASRTDLRSVKGALAGALLVLGFLAVERLIAVATRTLYVWGLLVAESGSRPSSAMNFTGSSTYTSPSGVEYEMRQAPFPWSLWPL